MTTVSHEQDAFGRALLDHFNGTQSQDLILQTDDGRSTPAMPPCWFFQTEDSWSHWEREALADVRGPILDLGAGAGRVSLLLQAKGHDVTAVDSSPGAIEVCRRQGIADARLQNLTDAPTDKRWRTALLLCGNLGLAGSWEGTRELLSRLHALCADDAVILADTVDATVHADEQSLAYQQRMREAGEYVGKVNLRLVYGELVGPWWRQVNIRIADVPALVANTGWTLRDHFVAGMDHYLKLQRV